MKKLKLICLITVSILITIPVYTQPQKIKVGYVPNYAMINKSQIRGAEGYGFEYFNEIEKYTNYEFEYIETQWEDAFENLKTGKIDLFAPVSMTENRKKGYRYIETPFCYETSILCTSLEKNYYYNDPSALNGKRVGMQSGSFSENIINEYEKKYNITLKRKYLDLENYADALKNDNIDIFLTGSLAQIDHTKIIDEFGTQPVYIIGNKENAELTTTIYNAIKQIEKENSTFNELLWFKYYGKDSKANKYITQEERKALSEKNSYSVGYHADLAPLSYKTEDGLPAGYSIDIMNILAEKLDITVNYVPLHDESNNSCTNLDFNLCTVNDDCAKMGNLSLPYDVQDIMILTKAGLHKDDVKHVTFLNYAAIDIEDFLASYKNATLHIMHSGKEVKDLSNTINIDCKIASSIRSQMTLGNSNFGDYTLSLLGVDLPVGITVSDDLPKEVLFALNKAIIDLDMYEVDEIVLKSISKLKESITFWGFLCKYRFVIISFFSLLIFTILLFHIRNTTNNEKRLKNLIEVDQLTGLMTIHKFKQELRLKLETANPFDYYLVSFDIDNLKYGHL